MSEKLKSLLPKYCQTITTKEVANALNITTREAYKLCVQAADDGWLYRLGYKNKFGGYDDPGNGGAIRYNSLTWQNVNEED